MSKVSGFTLMEILVVVLIISILATIVGVSVAKRPGEAKVVAAKATIANIRQAVKLYQMDNDMAPTQEQGLDALCQKPTRPPIPQKYHTGGYLEDCRIPPKDPWGRDYIYLFPGRQGESFEIMSYGSDGEPGGEGEAADISSTGQ